MTRAEFFKAFKEHKERGGKQRLGQFFANTFFDRFVPNESNTHYIIDGIDIFYSTDDSAVRKIIDQKFKDWQL